MLSPPQLAVNEAFWFPPPAGCTLGRGSHPKRYDSRAVIGGRMCPLSPSPWGHATKEAILRNLVHAPGPWIQHWQFIGTPDSAGTHPDFYIAEIAESDGDGRLAALEKQQANAFLIAAAPDLQEAAEIVVAR